MPQTKFLRSEPASLFLFLIQLNRSPQLIYDSHLGDWVCGPWILAWVHPSWLTLVSSLVYITLTFHEFFHISIFPVSSHCSFLCTLKYLELKFPKDTLLIFKLLHVFLQTLEMLLPPPSLLHKLLVMFQTGLDKRIRVCSFHRLKMRSQRKETELRNRHILRGQVVNQMSSALKLTSSSAWDCRETLRFTQVRK